MSEASAPPKPPEDLPGDAAPRGAAPASLALLARVASAPAMFRIHAPEDLATAATLGFDFALLPHSALARAPLPSGLGRLLEISLDQPEDDHIGAAHPDWFVHGAQGPALRFLSASDATVDYWDAQIAAFQAAGFAGFYCRHAHLFQPAVWRRLQDAAAARVAGTLFIAEVFGAPPEKLENFHAAGFSFCTSSSCWWDFRQAWLNEETARLKNIAPAIALAAPPGAKNWPRQAACRAMNFAAAFAPGWLLDAEFYHHEGYDLAAEVTALNRLRREDTCLQLRHSAQLRSSPGSAIAVLSRGASFVIAANAGLATAASLPAAAASLPAAAFLPALGHACLHNLQAAAPAITPASLLQMPAGAIAFYRGEAMAPVFLPLAPLLDCNAPRIAIEAITPQVDGGQFPVRRILGDLVTIEADLIADGHDKLAGEVLCRAADEQQPKSYPLSLLNNDRWQAQIPLERLGRHIVSIRAWKDGFASFTDELKKKHEAGIPTQLELREGLILVEEAARADQQLALIAQRLGEAPEATLREALLAPQMAAAMRRAAPRKFLASSHDIIIDAEPKLAAFASWYEIFPRSQSGDPGRHGNFTDVIGQLPRIAAMGFDVLYFPPLHPIGERNRKGRNNSLKAGPDDPGSPYAIGSRHGGHDALHPELGTFEDFRALIAAAQAHGIALALDFAIQCAPDHPWLKDHKGWFDWRPDGSLRHAENPPKKYEDIVNVDFYTESAKPALWRALRDIVQFWVSQGIRLFRVDNPHTKPFPFWEWLIADIRSRHPDVVFLAEAFTRPKIMYRLAKIGFAQSYTYFTWRNTKPELEEYLNELTTAPPKDYFRPHFFVNTPDINPSFLHHCGRPGFLIRAALATTLSGLWGMYNGFELCEAAAVPGKEEYLNSEKYEIKNWDYDRPGNITAEITRLNAIRKANAALHSHLNIEFLPCDNPNVLYFRKFAADGNTLLIAISLDPWHEQTTRIELPLWRFGQPDHGLLAAEDLFRAHEFVWAGKYQPVRLNPHELPFCIWRVGALTT